MTDYEGIIQLQEPITFDKMQEIFGSAENTERFYTTDADGNVTAEFINKSVIDDIRSELWMEGMNMTGEYQGVWVRFRDIERVIDKHIKAVEE